MDAMSTDIYYIHMRAIRGAIYMRAILLARARMFVCDCTNLKGRRRFVGNCKLIFAILGPVNKQLSFNNGPRGICLVLWREETPACIVCIGIHAWREKSDLAEMLKFEYRAMSCY